MFKSVMKEVCIMILLALAILSILGILFYEYIPASKTLPQMEAYITPENVKKEINEDVLNESTVVQTYSMDETEIKISKKQGDYKAGKQDPFADYLEKNNATATNASSAGTVSSGTTTQTQTQTQSGDQQQTGQTSDKGSFLPDRGTK